MKWTMVSLSDEESDRVAPQNLFRAPLDGIFEPPQSGIWCGELNTETCSATRLELCSLCAPSFLLCIVVLGVDTFKVMLDALLEHDGEWHDAP